MKRAFSGISVLTAAFLFTTIFTGCDLFNPPKKTPKKDASAQAVAPGAAEAPSSSMAKDVLVRVGSWTLTESQFEERLKLLKEGLPDFDAAKPGSKEALLNELIRQQLLVKDAENSGLARESDITEAVEDFRRTLLVQKLASQLTKDIVADEKEAQEYYDQNKDLFVDPVQYTVREIVVADEVTAKNILVQLLQGADFSETAKAQSKAKTASGGGALPAFAKAPFEAMQSAITNLDTGGVSAVFKGPEGFYIVKVDGKKGGAMKPFAGVKQDLISGLTLRKQQEAILDHLNQLAEKTKIEINKELLGPAK
ncbi:MAG: peptidyl-prolyl cis-trans isomerase [Candidatus Omnitrophica bacterium]|nr:peptidyl-prolyl cis-trans isomerase [Candidatus Omnitrophota bacterium]